MALLAVLAGALLWWRGALKAQSTEPIGLFTSLPILWSEQASVADSLKPQEPHWARAAIAQHGPIRPLDLLAPVEPGQGAPLAGLKRLVLAQPRPLSPAENVALDDWVRGGGQVLLLADPMLTEETMFPLGDKRRPQDTVLLSPILGRWGLELHFDEAQAAGAVPRIVMGMRMPTNLPGRLVVLDSARCRSWDDGLAATCRVGRGRVLVYADAAVLERFDPWQERARALDLLLETAFAVQSG